MYILKVSTSYTKIIRVEIYGVFYSSEDSFGQKDIQEFLKEEYAKRSS